jgi:hypothetical protein
MPGKKGRQETSTTILKASRQKYRSGRLCSNEKNGLQQFPMESCQPIKRLRDKKKLHNIPEERSSQSYSPAFKTQFTTHTYGCTFYSRDNHSIKKRKRKTPS